MRRNRTEEKSVESKKGKKKAIIIIVVIAVICISVLAGVSLWFWVIAPKKTTALNNNPAFGMPQISESANVISASGTTVVGVNEEKFEPDYLDTTLHIEEVYLSNRDEVESGTRILKVREKDIAAARRELNNALSEAELSYRAGVLTLEQEKISAQYTYDSTILAGQYAQEVYEETIYTLEKACRDAQKELDEALEDQQEYIDATQNDSYNEELNVDYLQQKYEEDLELLQSRVKKWGLNWSDVTGVDDDGESVSVSQEGRMNPNLGNAQNLYREVCEEYEEMKSAKENYDEKLNNAQIGLQKLEKNIPILELKLTQAQQALEEGRIEAEAELQTTLKKAEIAQDTYDTTVKKAQEELDSLKDDMDDAKEHLEEFEASIGDGYMYTGSPGTVLMLNAQKDSVLSGSQVVLAYMNREDVTIRVYVGQEDIDKLSVGEEAQINITDHGQYSGFISSINPVATGNSRTSVSYQVTLQIDGDVTELESNLTAQVVFGMGGGNEK